MAVEKGPNRKIILSDVISNATVNVAMQRILDINEYDDERNSKEKDYKVKPIELVINSPGGSVYDGFGLISVIENSKTPIDTYCFGRAMSMGFSIFLAGDRRYSGKYSTFMYHDISTFTGGSLEDIKRTVKEMERLSKQYDDYVLARTTHILKETLDGYKVRTENWYIDPVESVKLGIVHEIL
ncbi:MAG: hypothetical protein K0R18_186 [Bacillales bacterium]|jgi:ATP-dependent Clp protease protease subunit|nr:hypothetical protein [Bacillales bacterium]